CQELAIERLVMPRAAATFSAYGLLFADAIHAAATTAEWDLGSGDVDALNALYDRLETQAVEALRAEGFADERIVVEREADVKYALQSFEISMTWPRQAVAAGDREALLRRFHDEYERIYGAGAAWEGFPAELHTARVVATGITDKPPVQRAQNGRAAKAEPAGSREIRLGGRTTTARAYDGPALQPGA